MKFDPNASIASQAFTWLAAARAVYETEFYVRDADGDDGDGSAGVREPREPVPAAPAGSMALAYSG